ncbi:MAG: formylglycine-generating enzyme family protein [Actinomycetota bacterium]|nr:formylglycine-generating enzyme family protein [Actinomycetota bacterium]
MTRFAGSEDVSGAEVWAMGAQHPRSQVRLAVVRHAASCPDDLEARRLLAWAVNDPDDRVALAALEAVTRQRDIAALGDLFDAAGRSLAALDGIASGEGDARQRAVLVGLGHLLGAHADPGQARRDLSTTGYDWRQARRERAVDTAGMVFVTPGPGGGDGFFIDAHPVTWGDYQRFVEAVEEYGPLWRHPGAPTGEENDGLRPIDPGPLEARAGHPVTGVTWYEAWAYAAWEDKQLPTVSQWEVAAGVPLGSRYPWGDSPPSAVHAHFDHTGRVGAEPEQVMDVPAELLTAPVGSHPRGVSAAGVHDLAGNIWEWTRSRWIDEEDLTPFVGAASYYETVGDWTMSACIKGGSWASPAGDLEGAARGRKHVLQRGPETGFRCVFEPQGR